MRSIRPFIAGLLSALALAAAAATWTYYSDSLGIQATVTFPAIANGTCSSLTFPWPLPGYAGAACQAGSPALYPADGVVPSCKINATSDTGKLTLCNNSGASVTPPANAVVNVRVFQP